MTIQDKVVAVTGASSGIGEATARHLASRGAAVVLGARRTDRLDRLVDEITAAGGRAVSVRVDVADPDDLRSLVDLALDRWDRLDVLVGNAGISRIGTKPTANLIIATSEPGMRAEASFAMKAMTPNSDDDATNRSMPRVAAALGSEGMAGAEDKATEV